MPHDEVSEVRGAQSYPFEHVSAGLSHAVAGCRVVQAAPQLRQLSIPQLQHRPQLLQAALLRIPPPWLLLLWLWRY